MLFSPFFKCHFEITEMVFPPSDLICVSHPIELVFDSVAGDTCLDRVAYVPFIWGSVSVV